MKLHIFKSGKEPDVFGFTPDETGANLPDDFGPWLPSQEDTLDGGPTNSLTAGVGASGPIFAGIERDGFYVARSETIERLTGVPRME